jgi:hypothetical protein
VRPCVNQIEFNPGLLAVTEPVLQMCAEEGIIVEAYSKLSSLVYDGAKGGPLGGVVDSIAADGSARRWRRCCPPQMEPRQGHGGDIDDLEASPWRSTCLT